MLTLAFDTTTSTLSVALLAGQKILVNNTIFESEKQSELLIPEIEKALHSQKIWYQDLDLIATTNGPGSFTGTRIGITAARTIKTAINAPLILVNSCEVFAFKHREYSGKIFVVLDATNNELFFAEFLAQNEEIMQITEPRLISYDELLQILPKEDFLLCGSGKKIVKDLWIKQQTWHNRNEDNDILESCLIGLLALKKFQHSKSSKNLDPLYLRAPRISERKKR